MRRAFDEALAEAGGSLPVWLVLLNLKIRRPANQRELAEAVGVREATLTHHLNSMDAEGLITRQRDTTNRRIHVVELTDAGEETFLRLRTAAVAFDQRLRAGITEKEVASLEGRTRPSGPKRGGRRRTSPMGRTSGGQPLVDPRWPVGIRDLRALNPMSGSKAL